RSCARTPIRSASSLTRDVGSSSGSSRGSGAIDGWQKTSRLPSTPHAPSSTPHPSCCSCVGSLESHDFRNRLSVTQPACCVLALFLKAKTKCLIRAKPHWQPVGRQARHDQAYEFERLQFAGMDLPIRRGYALCYAKHNGCQGQADQRTEVL